ncbi:MAG: COX15/CtaA family protein [Legionellaceae bacterium]|nr:COX15/CtaA family protein [Legionellaceae bacterium]
MKVIRFVTTIAVVLAFFVVMLGAFTRLTDAGLGCPDWPGCYGRLVLPSGSQALAQAQQEYPYTPIESRKAWTEMAHRYAAGTLVLLVMIIVIEAFRQRTIPRLIPIVLILLIGFQAALGMWTVTLKLLPIVVMGHLLGGMLIFASLCYFRWQVSNVKQANLSGWRFWIHLGLIIVFCQIALGGWVSANYAGVACIGFPQCNGQWLPKLDFSTGFQLFSSVGANYQGGLLDNDSRITIHMIHRLGAVVTLVYLLSLTSLITWRIAIPSIRNVGLIVMMLVCLQFGLGIANVIYLLPLKVAVAHNGVAALLFASLLSLRYLVAKGGQYARQRP